MDECFETEIDLDQSSLRENHPTGCDGLDFSGFSFDEILRVVQDDENPPLIDALDFHEELDINQFNFEGIVDAILGYEERAWIDFLKDLFGLVLPQSELEKLLLWSNKFPVMEVDPLDKPGFKRERESLVGEPIVVKKQRV